MYKKFKNTKTGLDFVVNESSAVHYEDNKTIVYIGLCDEAGNITVRAEEDIVYQQKTTEEQLALVEATLKKKIVKAAPSRGSKKSEMLTDEDGVAEDLEVDDED